ncbi:hypothetical protein [Massilia sp. METH4]|uniref:hypothetical protein n=1 Tax=Massilia sp. METH4 TaxID=3123041 RepID=UPI0030CB35A7
MARLPPTLALLLMAVALAAPLSGPALAAPLTGPALAAPASGFPTVARVEYVLECMNSHGGKQESLYKCACVIDRIGAALAYDDYVTMSTALRYQTLEGERGAEFRDPPGVKAMAAKYKALREEAERACMLR